MAVVERFNCRLCDFEGGHQFSRVVYKRKLTLAWVSYQDDFLISLFEGTINVDKIHMRFKIANIAHALHVPVYQQTDFTMKHVVVWH